MGQMGLMTYGRGLEIVMWDLGLGILYGCIVNC